MNINSSHHATHSTVTRELGLSPHVTIGTVLLLLVLQVESRYRRVMRTLLSNIANTTFCSIDHTGESLSDDGVVGLLAAMSLVMPTREIPLQESHETLVSIITLQTTDYL